MYKLKWQEFNNEENLLLSDKVYRTLCYSIAGGLIKPGEHLKENDLATQMSISRSPVRRALIRLEQEGFLSKSGGRSIVDGPSQKDVRDSLELREIFEQLAIRHAIGKRTNYDVERLFILNKEFATALSQKLIKEAVIADEAFHAHIYELTNNKVLLAAIEDSQSMLYRYRVKSIQIFENTDILIRQHMKIIRALADADTERAVTVAKEHIREQKKAILDSLLL